jgi:hypothetical protein
VIDDEARATSRSKREGLAPLIVSGTLYVFRSQLQGFSGSGAPGTLVHRDVFGLSLLYSSGGSFPMRPAPCQK